LKVGKDSEGNCRDLTEMGKLKTDHVWGTLPTLEQGICQCKP